MYPRRGCIGYEFFWKHVFLALKKNKDLQEVIISTQKKNSLKYLQERFGGTDRGLAWAL
jgi:hypothetical protein